MKIAISGTAGSGKSTIAKMLAKMFGYRHYSMGDFQREIAKEKKVSITELGEMEKNDPKIDLMVDDKQKQLGMTQDDFVIDAWLSPYFIPDSYKVFMDADIKERAMRVYKREPKDYKDLSDAIKKIRQRENTNRKRWKKFYGYDFRNNSNYDLVIDTTGKDAKETIGLVYQKVIEKCKR